MVNSARENPIFIDTANTPGEAGPVTAKVQIRGVSIRASADNWVVKVRSTESGAGFVGRGTVVLDLESKITNDRGGFFPINVDATGIWVETLTNITSLLVYKRATV